MPTAPQSPTVIRQVLRELAKYAGNPEYYIAEKTQAGQKSALEAVKNALGIPSGSIHSAISNGATRYGWTWRDFVDEAPELDEDELGGGKAILLAHAEINAAYIDRQRRNTVRAFVVPKEPLGVGFVGDPHLENKGSDLKAFYADLELLRASGIRAVNMGDLLDNFHETGKLASKQADNRMSVKEAYAAAKWVVKDSGVKWDANLIGNHDAWGGHGYAAMLQQWASETGSRFYDWVVGLSYSWGDGGYKVLAAHDFRGHSLHNPLHGPMRRAVEDGWADCYVAGHRHNAAEAAHENGFRERRYTFLRVKGYKAHDDYAKTRGFPQQKEGASAMLVIDPHSETMAGRARTFLDLGEGAEYLQFLKGRS